MRAGPYFTRARGSRTLLAMAVLLLATAEVSMGEAIQLPAPRLNGETSLEETIAERRSKRAFTSRDLTRDELGQLLWAAQGVTLKRGGTAYRSAPSAGARYPLEVYVVSAGGTYRYAPAAHALEPRNSQDLRRELAGAALGQGAVAEAPATLVLCAVFARVTDRYGGRGKRYVHMEAGHAAQNVHLQAVALGLGSVPIGAFDDGKVTSLLDLPREEDPLYLIPVGHPR